MGRRGFRTMLSRSGRTSPYSHLREETILETSTEEPSSNLRPVVAVSVATSSAATPELECISGADAETSHYDNIIISSSSGNGKRDDDDEAKEEEKEEETSPEGYEVAAEVFEKTRQAAIEMVRSASSMSEAMVKSLSIAAASAAATGDEKNHRGTVPSGDSPDTAASGEEKTGDSGDEPLETKVHQTMEEARLCGKSFLESGMGCVDTAFETTHTALATTHRAAHDLVEASASMGKEVMASTEACSQAAIRLPLSPELEQTSERLESACESALSEVQEFVDDHYAMLRDYNCEKMVQQKLQTMQQEPPKGRIRNVHAVEDTVLNVSIEVQMKAKN